MAERRRTRTFGSIRRLPSGRWQARYYDRAGRRHTAPTTFPTKADAAAYLATVEADMRRGVWTNPALARVTFRQWVERWREVAFPILRPSTQDLYAYLLRRFLLPAFETTPLGQLDPLLVRAWHAGLKADQTVSASTKAKAYRLLSQIMAAAVEARYVPYNPCTIKGAGVEHAPEMRAATVEQVDRLAAAVAPRYRALVLLAAYGGLRWGELAGLRRHLVNPLRGTVQVASQLSEVAGRFFEGPPKTAAGLRTIAVPKFVMEALREHLDRYAEPGPTGLVFSAPEGGYLRRSNFRRRHWLPAIRAVGLEGLRFHDLRHTAATFARAAGATTKELMARMGHTTPQVALRYEHVMADRDAVIAAGLDRLVQKGKGTSGARRQRKQVARRAN